MNNSRDQAVAAANSLTVEPGHPWPEQTAHYLTRALVLLQPGRPELANGHQLLLQVTVRQWTAFGSGPVDRLRVARVCGLMQG